MANVAELAAEVKLKGASEATKQIKELTNSFGFLGNVISGLMDISETGMRTLSNWAQQGVRVAREIDRVSFKTGIGAGAFQRLDQAFKQHGGNIDSLISSYQRLQQRQAQWKFLGGLSETEGRAFGYLGLDPSKYGDTMDLLKAITDSLLKIDDIGQRNMLAGILGIDEDFLRVAAKGKYYINDLLTLSKEEQKTLNDWEQNYNAVTTDFENALTKLGVMVVSGQAKDFTQWVIDVDHFFSNAVGHAKDLGDVIDNIGGTSENRNWFGKITDFWDFMTTVKEGVESKEDPHLTAIKALGQISAKMIKRDARLGGAPVASTEADIKDIVEYELRAGGLKGHGVAGALGNIMQESSFNPNALNGSHFGLAQWDRNRQAEMARFANGADVSDPRVQAQFLMREIRQRGLLDKLNNARSPEEAAYIFEKGIEQSGGQDMQKRLAYSRQFADSMMDKYSGVSNSYMTSNDNRNATVNITNENKISTNYLDKDGVVSISEDSFGKSVQQASQIIN